MHHLTKIVSKVLVNCQKILMEDFWKILESFDIDHLKKFLGRRSLPKGALKSRTKPVNES